MKRLEILAGLTLPLYLDSVRTKFSSVVARALPDILLSIGLGIGQMCAGMVVRSSCRKAHSVCVANKTITRQVIWMSFATIHIGFCKPKTDTMCQRFDEVHRAVHRRMDHSLHKCHRGHHFHTTLSNEVSGSALSISWACVSWLSSLPPDPVRGCVLLGWDISSSTSRTVLPVSGLVFPRYLLVCPVSRSLAVTFLIGHWHCCNSHIISSV